MNSQEKALKSRIKMSLNVIRKYDWLLDLYVLVSQCVYSLKGKPFSLANEGRPYLVFFNFIIKI